MHKYLQFRFDGLGSYLTPTLTLANPQKDQTYIMGILKEIKPVVSFNALSELSFVVPFIAPYYDKLVQDRLVKMEGFGWYVIVEVKEKNDGYTKQKEIKCYSYEHTLSRVAVDIPDGTYQFYNPISPYESLLYKLVGTIPPWSIGYVSSSLNSKWRTFEISNDTSVYSFLMSEVENAYECVFVFDTENMVIHVYDVNEAVTNTDIVLTFDNLLKSLDIDSNDTGVITMLHVEGDSTLDISAVNPLGTAFLYNFRYYKTTDFMSQSLINALTAWEAKADAQQQPYANLLSQLKTKNGELIVLESNLVELVNEWNGYETYRTQRIVQGFTDLSEITNQIMANEQKQAEQRALITAKKNEIAALQGSLSAINTFLAFENNFSGDQLAELRCFMKAGQHSNDNFGVLESMDAIEVQELAQELYDQGKRVLDRLAQPIYTFSLDAVNFVFLQKYADFQRQLTMGAVMHIELREGVWFRPALLKIEYNYDNPTDFKLTFSNRLRLSDAEWTFAELMNDESKTTAKVYSNMSSLLETRDKMNEVWEWKNSALNLINQQIQSTENQEMVMDQHGLWGRRRATAGDGFDKEQFRLTNNVIAFTDDNWQTVKLAMGKIPNPINPNTYNYGLLAEVLVGDLIAGSNLLITNENNSVRIDGSGATFHNCGITVVRSDNKAQIVLDPANGFKLQKKNGNALTDVVYMDYDGNAVFVGNITANDGYFAGELHATKGTIGGWQIYANMLQSNYGDYISSIPTGVNGQLGQLGLFSWGQYPTTGIKWARFDGEISANQITGYLTNNHFRDDSIDALKLSRWSVRGSNYLTMWGSHIAPGSIGSSDIGIYQITMSHFDVSLANSLSTITGAMGFSHLQSTVNQLSTTVSNLSSTVNSLSNKVNGYKTTSSAGTPPHTHSISFY